MKYIVLVINNPFGRYDGFVNHRATSVVLNNKYYDSKEEAEQVAEKYRKEVYHTEILKRFNIPEELFLEIRNFVLTNDFIHLNGRAIKNKYTQEQLIQLFIEMYGLEIDYGKDKFLQDEKTYQILLYDEPVVTVVEIDNCEK